MTGGVIVKGRRRIQFDFMFEGIRYRPTSPPAHSRSRKNFRTFAISRRFRMKDRRERAQQSSMPFSRIANRG